jgi:hypothetical protein
MKKALILLSIALALLASCKESPEQCLPTILGDKQPVMRQAWEKSTEFWGRSYDRSTCDFEKTPVIEVRIVDETQCDADGDGEHEDGCTIRTGTHYYEVEIDKGAIESQGGTRAIMKHEVYHVLLWEMGIGGSTKRSTNSVHHDIFCARGWMDCEDYGFAPMTRFLDTNF